MVAHFKRIDCQGVNGRLTKYDGIITFMWLKLNLDDDFCPMKPTRENIQPNQGSSFSCLEIDQPEFDSHYHYHPEFEITWIVEGEGQRLIGDVVEPFCLGDLVVIGGGVPHQYRNWKSGRARAKVIQFSRDVFGSDFLRMPEFEGIRQLLDEAARGLRFSVEVQKMACCQIDELFESASESNRALRLMALLDTLGQDSERESVASDVYAKPVKVKKMERLERVLNYLEGHWRESITLADAAQVAALHPQSLSRFFRQHLGMNFQEYLVRLRVSRAAQRLIETDRTVADIAFECGFNNLSNFNYQFKRIKGGRPSEFRGGSRATGGN